MRWRVPLHSPNRVPVVRVVALSVDIKQYIHIFREGILRRVHVGVSQSWVVCLGMLAVNDRVMVGHPTGLLRTYFHRFLFCLVVCFFNKRSYTHHESSNKSKLLLCLIHSFFFYFRSPEIEQDNLFLQSPSVRLCSFCHWQLSEARINWIRPFNKRALTCESQMRLY